MRHVAPLRLISRRAVVSPARSSVEKGSSSFVHRDLSSALRVATGPRVAGAVAGDLHHRFDQFMIPDAAVVRPRHRAQFDATVIGLKRLHQFGAVFDQTVLQVDAGQGRRQLTQIARRGADQARQLAERPMGGGHRLVAARYDQPQPLAVIATGLDTHGAAIDGPRHRLLRARADCLVQRGQRQEALVVGAREPFRRDAGNVLAA
jgi:hypothetical protein